MVSFDAYDSAGVENFVAKATFHISGTTCDPDDPGEFQ